MNNKPKIYDCFSFFNELDLLEIRLNELDPYVDYFVISEMPVTHTNEPKPLYFEQNKHRFEKFLYKIIHIVAGGYDDQTSDTWIREHYQRDRIDRALKSCNDDDIIIISDIDEIPRGSKIKEFDPKKGLMYFEQSLFKYYLNCKSEIPKPDKGIFSRITTVGYLKKTNERRKIYTITSLRYEMIDESQKISDGGWHFSWLCNKNGKNVLVKLLSYAHREVVDKWILNGYLRNTINTQNITEKDYIKIENDICKGIDVFENKQLNIVDIDNSFPNFILQNKSKFVDKNYILELSQSRIEDVAIIMPYYNAPEHIANSVKHILEQSYENWHLFIVDDGSEENKKASLILKDIKKENITFIEKRNGGQSSARNTAIDFVKYKDYKYIAYCDSDDLWEKNYLESQIKALNELNCDLVYSDVETRFSNGTQAIRIGIPNPDKHPGIETMVRTPFIFISSVVHKKECLSVGPFDSNLDSIEDADMWVRIAKAGFKLAKNNKTKITYMVKPENENMASKKTNIKQQLFNEKHQDVLNKKLTVTVGIPTRNRYDVLAHSMLSIALQTVKPKEIIIVDDSDEPIDIRKNEIFSYILGLFNEYNISWRVIFGRKSGQHFSHQVVQEQAVGDLIFRIDDDEIAENNVLELLLSQFSDNVGAVAPLVLMPGAASLPETITNNYIDNLDIPNMQWFKWNGQKSVDHLYSCFMYRKGIMKYELSLSPKAFREETMFTYGMKLKGYDLIINADARVWHFRGKSGGIR